MSTDTQLLIMKYKCLLLVMARTYFKQHLIINCPTVIKDQVSKETIFTLFQSCAQFSICQCFTPLMKMFNMLNFSQTTISITIYSTAGLYTDRLKIFAKLCQIACKHSNFFLRYRNKVFLNTYIFIAVHGSWFFLNPVSQMDASTHICTHIYIHTNTSMHICTRHTRVKGKRKCKITVGQHTKLIHTQFMGETYVYYITIKFRYIVIVLK